MPIMKRAFINPNKCRICHECNPLLNCPAGAISREDEEEPSYVETYCVGCGQCIKMCPYSAISMV